MGVADGADTCYFDTRRRARSLSLSFLFSFANYRLLLLLLVSFSFPSSAQHRTRGGGLLERGWWCALLLDLASNSSISIVQINGDNYIFAVILSVEISFLPLFVFLMRDIFFTSLIVLYRWMDLIFFFFYFISSWKVDM